MPCLTPCLLTTHDIYSMSGDGFCSTLWEHGTLSPASTNWHGADRPNHLTAAGRTTQTKSSRGYHAITFNLFSQAAATPLCVSAAVTEAGDCSGQSCPSQPCAQSWASPLQPSCGCRLLTEKPSCGCHHRSLNTSPSRHLDSSNFSLVGTAGSSFTRFIHHTRQKCFSLPLTAFTAAVILYDTIYRLPSKPISVFIAKWSVKNG